MYGILLAVHVVVAIILVTLILIQQGKGAQTGASFGSGASQTVFGSQGSGGFISSATSTLAALFFLLSLGLAVLASRSVQTHTAPTHVDTTPQTPGALPPSGTTGAPSGGDIPALD